MIEIKKEISNNYIFILKAESGHTLLNSVTFPDKKIAKDIVQSLNKISIGRNTFERKTNHNGEFLFSMKDMNGKIIGNSQFYQSEAGMENGIKNLIKRINSLNDLDQL